MKALMTDSASDVTADSDSNEEVLPNSYIEETSFTLGDILDSAEVSEEF